MLKSPHHTCSEIVFPPHSCDLGPADPAGLISLATTPRLSWLFCILGFALVVSLLKGFVLCHPMANSFLPSKSLPRYHLLRESPTNWHFLYCACCWCFSCWCILCLFLPLDSELPASRHRAHCCIPGMVPGAY